MATSYSEPVEQESLFEGGPEFDPSVSDPETPERAEEPAPDPEFERMTRELEESRAQLASERERLDRFLTQPPAPQPIPAPPVQATPMPDPATDPEAFARWHAEDAQRRDAELRSEVTRTRNEMTTQQRAAQLRAEFKAEYPHLVPVLEYADIEFMRIQPDGVIPNDTTALKRDIAQALEEKTGRRATTPPTRTAGVSGSSETRPKKSKPSEPEVKEGDGSLVDLIKEAQAKSGLYG